MSTEKLIPIIRDFQPSIIKFIIQEMRSFFAYIAILICLSSCNKEDHVCSHYTPGTDVAPASSLSSYQFKQGSYWVYRNDVTGQVDSQRVESIYTHDWFSGGGSSTCSGATSFHEYTMHVRSFLTDQHFNYYIIGAYLYKDSTFEGRFSGRYIFNNLNSFTPESGLEQLEIIPSMNLNGNNVQNVKKILSKHLTGQNLSNYDLHYYFADSIGLVKWEVVDGSTILESWSIKSWEVVL